MAEFFAPVSQLTSLRFARHNRPIAFRNSGRQPLFRENQHRRNLVPFNVPLADTALAAIKTGQAAASGVVTAIRDASARSGMPFNVMLASAQMESGLNPNAQASTSSATGLFQFIDQTWL